MTFQSSLIENNFNSEKRKFIYAVSAFCTAESLDPCPEVLAPLCDESCLIDNNQFDWTPLDFTSMSTADIQKDIANDFNGNQEAFLSYIGAVCTQSRVEISFSIKISSKLDPLQPPPTCGETSLFSVECLENFMVKISVNNPQCFIDEYPQKSLTGKVCGFW